MTSQPFGQAWFRPKDFGYGATPCSWQGWLATAVFVLLIMATVALGHPGGDPGRGPVAALLSVKARLGLAGFRLGQAPMVGLMVLEIVGFTVLARAKSSGPWFRG